MNQDLIRARDMLLAQNFTCVLCRGDEIHCCTERGVLPLLLQLRDGPKAGFSAADKVIGKATAFLYVLLGIRAVYSPVVSESALEVLQRHGIKVFYDNLVPAIYNRARTGYCPMESAVQEIDDPIQALRAIEETLKTLSK